MRKLANLASVAAGTAALAVVFFQSAPANASTAASPARHAAPVTQARGHASQATCQNITSPRSAEHKAVLRCSEVFGTGAAAIKPDNWGTGCISNYVGGENCEYPVNGPRYTCGGFNGWIRRRSGRPKA